MGTASAEHKIVEVELIKSMCRKNSEGNKIEDVWERYYLWTIATYILLV